MKAGNVQVDAVRDLVESIVSGDTAAAIRLLAASPQLARECAISGATRRAANQDFFARIRHYMYEGDTALHMATAAYQTRIVQDLIAAGADVRARNIVDTKERRVASHVLIGFTTDFGGGKRSFAKATASVPPGTPL